MASLKKRSRDMIQEGFEKKGTSSYWHLKMKFAACKIEKERLEVLVHDLRKELQETLITKEELEAIGMEEDCDPANNDTSLGSSCHAMKTKHDITESNHTLLKKVVAKQRDEIHELKKHNEQL